MPGELGGTGDQVTPGWLFRAGLASCAATSIAMTAAAEGIELTTLEVRASSRSDTRGLLGMTDADGAPVYAGPSDVRMHVRIFAPDAPPERLRALVEKACRCSPIPAAVVNAVPLDLRVDVAAEAADPSTMDALSETLRVVRLVGAIFINARFTAPWCYQSPNADSAAPVLEPGAERVVIFHLITEGECYVEIGKEAPRAPDRRRRRGVSAGRRASDELGSRACRRRRARRLDEVLSRRPRQLALRRRRSNHTRWCAATSPAMRAWRGCCSRDCRRWCGSTCAAPMPAPGSKPRCATRWPRRVRRVPAARACWPSWPRCCSSRCCACT